VLLRFTPLIVGREVPLDDDLFDALSEKFLFDDELLFIDALLVEVLSEDPLLFINALLVEALFEAELLLIEALLVEALFDAELFLIPVLSRFVEALFDIDSRFEFPADGRLDGLLLTFPLFLYLPFEL
jgi:hypothetical protein